MQHLRLCAFVGLITLVAACEDAPVEPRDSASFSRSNDNHAGGFRTTAGAQARLVSGVVGEVTPLVTVGDVMPGSDEPFAPLPDGIGAFNRYGLTLFMNHELAGVERTDGGSDYPFARVSELEIDKRDLKIRQHRYVIDGTEGYERLCSAEWFDAKDGFAGGYFFTGEEVTDGLQLAIDRRGHVIETPWIGRYAHENQISVPGFPRHTVILNFDDNGGSGTGVKASLSELYMYVGRTSRDVLTGKGQLYVFKSDDVEHPGQLTAGQSITGYWLPIPDDVVRDAAALEQYGEDHDAFPFVRLEDGFYDKRRGVGPVAYFYDTGRGSIRDESGNPWDPWGSIYRLEFKDRRDPAGGSAMLTLLARSSGPDNGWASPDNGDMDRDGVIMLQEDPANSPWTRRPAIWKLKLNRHGRLMDPVGTKIVEVVEPDDPDNDAIVFGWETSGIIDASEWFGEGTWIFDVQAHDKPVPSLGLAEDNGQLLFLDLGRHGHHKFDHDHHDRD